MALEAGHQLGKERDEALGTDEVGSGPGSDQSVLDGRSVASLPWALDRRRGKKGLGQEADGVFSGVAGGSDKFIKDQRLVRIGGVLVAGSNLGE